MRERTDHEYAAAAEFCARREAGESLPDRILVIDLDRLSAGLCRCDEYGGIALEAEVPSRGEAGFFAALAGRFGGDAAFWADHWAQHEEAANRTLKNHALSAGRRDAEVLRAEDGQALGCAEAEELFRPTTAPLKDLLAGIDGLLARQEGGVLLLRVGRHAAVFFAVNAVRAHFNGGLTGLMDDERFAARRPGLAPWAYAARGRDLYELGAVERQRPFGHDILLVLRQAGQDGELREAEAALTGAQSLPDELNERPRRSAPFYLGGAAGLLVRIDGRDCRVPLPEGARPALAEAFVRLEGETALLCVADPTRPPEAGLRIPLNLGG